MKKNLLLALALATACADAAPAYYRQQIGDLRVTALFDGTLHLPRGDIKNIPVEDVAKLLADSSANEDEGGILASVNAFLIERGGEKVLVDSGTADCFASKPDKLGQVPEALAAAGINVADIKNILLTHGHSDHLCGLINADGSAAYPNATVWINAAENRYWHSEAEKPNCPKPSISCSTKRAPPSRPTKKQENSKPSPTAIPCRSPPKQKTPTATPSATAPFASTTAKARRCWSGATSFTSPPSNSPAPTPATASIMTLPQASPRANG